ncbi:MAG: hypothetical protein P8R04_01860 [Gammaproteobacteria bacterium]|nr:hypothetical protein [Gammaproteobacteria bacterium]
MRLILITILISSLGISGCASQKASSQVAGIDVEPSSSEKSDFCPPGQSAKRRNC